MKRTTFLTRICAAGLLAFAGHAFAAPGAHGPNGEHLDGPATQAATSGAPRMETFSETFELVGRLAGGEFSMFINRYATNEPVNGATVELELGDLKAQARFHQDQGDYAVADADFVKALSAPGAHAMVIMVMDGDEADLLEGTLHIAAAAPDSPGHDQGHLTTIALVAMGAALFLAFLGWLVLRRSAAPKPTGDVR